MTGTAAPRLNDHQVDFFRQEGCLIYRQPFFSPEKLQGLKDCFEELLPVRAL